MALRREGSQDGLTSVCEVEEHDLRLEPKRLDKSSDGEHRSVNGALWVSAGTDMIHSVEALVATLTGPFRVR